LVKSNLPDSVKKATLLQFDRVLGLGLAEWRPIETSIPDDIWRLIQQRQQARLAGQWQIADQLRGQINAAGYEVEDTPQGPQVQRATIGERA
jgi:cysteinyl-tRNA synthetase